MRGCVRSWTAARPDCRPFSRSCWPSTSDREDAPLSRGVARGLASGEHAVDAVLRRDSLHARTGGASTARFPAVARCPCVEEFVATLLVEIGDDAKEGFDAIDGGPTPSW